MFDLKQILASAVLLFSCLSASAILAEEATPTPVPTAAPACSLAEIMDALPDSATCSVTNTVVFGRSISDFISTQCGGVNSPDQSSSSKLKGIEVCSKCAKQAGEAYIAAAKAGLIKGKVNKSMLGEGKLKSICRRANSEEGDGENDALKGLYDQLKLCLPQEGQTADVTVCVTCGKSVLADALAANVITAAKKEALLGALPGACRGKRGDNGKGGDDKDGSDSSSSGSSSSVNSSNSSSGGDNHDGPKSNAFMLFHNALVACIINNPSNASVCTACVSALDIAGLEEKSRAENEKNYALSRCNGTFLPTPTPGNR